MIKAEHAKRIMQRYEDDYDNFLDKLKAKRNAKKQQAAKAKTEADKADKNVKQAEAKKPAHLKEKAKNLLDKAGGIEGLASTAQNVMKYFKTDTSAGSDYQMSFGGGGDAPPPEKKILGMPPAVVYVVGAVLLLAGLYGLSRLVKGKQPNPPAVTIPLNNPAPQVLQAA
jgi:hypothetical protein